MRTGRILLLTLGILALVCGGSAWIGSYTRNNPERAIHLFNLLALWLPWLIGAMAVLTITSVLVALWLERRKK